MVQALSSLEEMQAVLQQPGGVVVDFGAPWCGPCRFIAPKFEALSQEFPDVRFYKVDIDEAQDIAEKLQIMGVPTFMFFKDGAVVSSFAGANIERLVEGLNQISENGSNEVAEVPEVPEVPLAQVVESITVTSQVVLEEVSDQDSRENVN